jgi:membrane-associated phospholipid phosphatase
MLAIAVVLVAATAAAEPQAETAPQPVARWNAFAASVLQRAAVDPLNQSRLFAIQHAAVHDALNAIKPRYLPYTPGLATRSQASPEAAVAAASRHVLVALMPGEHEAIDSEYERALAEVPPGAKRDAGAKLGRLAAAANLERRDRDGHAEVTRPLYATTGKSGDYQFTEGFDFAALPSWGRMMTFGIAADEHRLPGPDALDGILYAADFNLVKAIGGANSTMRTAEQSEIAQFWYEDSPIGWNRIARTIIDQQRLDAWESARVLALVNFAMADGFIAGFAEKYEHRFWRPVTAIRNAEDDGNPQTEPDADWKPFLVTPPVPDYPSTHTVLGAAAAEILIAIFGDNLRYSMTSTSLPGVTRHFVGFSAAAMENGASRVYAGIHFARAVMHGYELGRNVGRSVSRMLPPGE